MEEKKVSLKERNLFKTEMFKILFEYHDIFPHIDDLNNLIESYPAQTVFRKLVRELLQNNLYRYKLENAELTYKFFNDFKDTLDWNVVSLYVNQNTETRFYKEYKNYLNWDTVTNRIADFLPNFAIDFLLEMKDFIVWKKVYFGGFNENQLNQLIYAGVKVNWVDISKQYHTIVFYNKYRNMIHSKVAMKYAINPILDDDAAKRRYWGSAILPPVIKYFMKKSRWKKGR